MAFTLSSETFNSIVRVQESCEERYKHLLEVHYREMEWAAAGHLWHSWTNLDPDGINLGTFNYRGFQIDYNHIFKIANDLYNNRSGFDGALKISEALASSDGKFIVEQTMLPNTIDGQPYLIERDLNSGEMQCIRNSICRAIISRHNAICDA